MIYYPFCLAFVTHNLTKDTLNYINYLKKSVNHIFDLWILYDTSGNDIIQENLRDFNVFFFDSRRLENFFLEGDHRLPCPVKALIKFSKTNEYDHYLLMESDIVLKGNFTAFALLVQQQKDIDYLYISTDHLKMHQHWPTAYIDCNPFRKLCFSWSQICYLSFSFIKELDVYLRKYPTIYYEMLLPSLALIQGHKTKTFESLGYQFEVSWGPSGECEFKYIIGNKPNTFYHPIKNLKIVDFTKVD